MTKLRVWWIPQIPGKPFYVPVSSVDDGVLILKTLTDYDKFQFEANVKPDYCNAGGLEMQSTPDDPNSWEDWYDEEFGFDDPFEYLQFLEQTFPCSEEL